MSRNFVKVLTYTWSKDSHGLFDYESAHLFTGKFKITGEGQFFRNNNEINMKEAKSHNETQEENHLFDVYQSPVHKDRYYLSTKNDINSHHGIGLVVRGIKKDGQPSGYELKVGDHLKVGRVKFVVREIKDINGTVTKLKTAQEIDYYQLDKNNTQAEPGSGATCRICLMDDLYTDPIENTLVSPCKCKGSCEYVHIKCLKQWIDSKKHRIENSSNTCLAFNYKKLSCEICKENLPYSVKLNDQEVEIVDIKKPENIPYMLIEKIENARENRGLYLIKAAEEDVRIGRGHTNSILVSDISVSRNHASISYKDGKFLLFDKNSKFGTLVQLNQPIEVSGEKTIIQCGKTVVILSIKRESLAALPKVMEVMEILDSPGTPSTMNDPEGEQKQNMNESERPKRKRGRPRKAERKEYNIQAEPGQSLLLEAEPVEEEQALESKILSRSKKIFKIIKPESNSLVDEEPADFGKRKGRKRN